MIRKYSVEKFKHNFLSLLDIISKNSQEIVITQNGRAFAKLVSVLSVNASPFGVMAGTGKVVGDIVKSPIEKWQSDQAQ